MRGGLRRRLPRQVETLPNNATQQREQLVRRLAAKDSSIDVLSTDVVYTAEFANAGFLRPYTADEKARLTAGMLRGTGGDRHVEGHPVRRAVQVQHPAAVVPQIACRRGGRRPESPDFTWDEMIKAAVAQGKRVAVQGARYEGYMVWVNALVLGRRWSDHQRPRGGPQRHPEPCGPGRARRPRRSSASWPARPRPPPDLSTAQEEQARATFQGDNGMFMVNWPYVLAAARSAVEEGTLSQPWLTTSAGRATRGVRRQAQRSRRSAAPTSASAPTPGIPIWPWRSSSA